MCMAQSVMVIPVSAKGNSEKSSSGGGNSSSSSSSESKSSNSDKNNSKDTNETSDSLSSTSAITSDAEETTIQTTETLNEQNKQENSKKQYKTELTEKKKELQQEKAILNQEKEDLEAEYEALLASGETAKAEALLASINELNEQIKDTQAKVKETINERYMVVKTLYSNTELQQFNSASDLIKQMYQDAKTLDAGGITVNNNLIKFDAPAYIKGGVTLVPLRAISEELGAQVSWNEETNTVTITKDDKVIEITGNSTTVMVNGTPVEISNPAEVTCGRTYLPLRFLSEALDFTVTWDEENEIIDINEPEKDVTSSDTTQDTTSDDTTSDDTASTDLTSEANTQIN